MTESEAEAKLDLLLEGEPGLDEDQLADLLTYARRPDEDGNVYGDAEWTPTWDFDAAAAEGWRRKAGIAAAKFNFAEDSQRFDRAQVYAHCASQAQHYANKAVGSLPT